MAQVTLRTADGIVHEVAADEETSILDAAAAQDLVLPAQCGQGTCGSCLGHVRDGKVRRGPVSPGAIGPDAGEGAALLCRTYALSDVEVELPYEDSRIADSAPVERMATITGLEWRTADVVRVLLRLDPHPELGAAVEVDPGQFLELQPPGTDAWRAYSLASGTSWDGDAELFIRVLPAGVASTWLRERAAVGDRVLTRGPRGGFGLAENGMRPRWFVAGGTGLAPMLAMLRRMAEWGEAQPARLYLGVSTAEHLFAEAELDELAAALPGLEVLRCIRHETRPGMRAASAVDLLAEDLPGVVEAPDLYLCGSPSLMDAIEALVARLGIAPEQVRTERFLS